MHQSYSSKTILQSAPNSWADQISEKQQKGTPDGALNLLQAGLFHNDQRDP